MKAAVSFADTATKTPQVVEAIAVNTTLLALFDTARGVKEPVALAKALADTAKAAAGDPVTLESLLRGGGMDKVLKVMPAKATLVDVVEALAKGGLPAAVEVVYPTAPTTPELPSTPSPTFSLQLSFQSVKQGDFDLNLEDNITNKDKADVTFSYVGRDLRPDQHFEYSLDGEKWIKENVTWSAKTKTVVLEGVQLGHPQHITTFGGVSSDVTTTTPLPNFPFLPTLPTLPTLPPLPTLPTLPNVPNLDPFNKVTTILVRAADSNNAHTTAFEQKIIYDGYVMQPQVALKNDTFHKALGSNIDLVTKDGALDVTHVEPGAEVEFVVITQQPQKVIGPFGLPTTGTTPDTTPVSNSDSDNDSNDDSDSNDNPDSGSGSNTDFDMPPVNADWTKAPKYEQGMNTVWVRVTDIAGNQSYRKFEFTLDSEAPKTPTIKLHSSTTDSTSNLPVSNGQIDISGLEYGPNNAWEYSLDGGMEWIIGANAADINGKATLDVTGTGDKSVLVRQFDSAGNVSTQTRPLDFTIAEQQPQAPVEVRATHEGIEVKPNAQGAMVLAPLDNTLSPTTLFNAGPAVNGWIKVAAPDDQVTGVVGISSSNDSVLLDPTGTVYTLGSDDADTIVGSYAYGFGGDDDMTGTDGNDFLSGGDGNDTIDGGPGDDVIIGGVGSDVIIASGGNDRIVINDASESYFWFGNDEFAPTFDQVEIKSPDTLVFDFKANVTKAYNEHLDLHPESFIEEIYMALNMSYAAAAGQEGGAAVLMSSDDGLMLLVVDNGDHQIDTQDIVVQIVGTDYGAIFADPNGNVEFNPYIN